MKAQVFLSIGDVEDMGYESVLFTKIYSLLPVCLIHRGHDGVLRL